MRLQVGLATPDHTPAGRGWQESEIYFDGANDYWTSISGACANNATADAGGKAPMPITDLWLTGNGTQPAGGAPAYGLNNSWSCSQANQPGSCVYEDTFFVERLLAAIRSHDTATPFFGIFAPHNIHAPLQVPAAWLTRFSFIEDPRRQAYAAKVAWLDSQLALVVDALKTRSMWDNLLLVLTADNGGPIYDSGGAGANNFPMRGGKTSNWQGGARANSFVSGGLIPPARRGTVEQGFVSVEDWYATFCALAGVDKTDTRAAAAGLPPVDSVDLWPLISGANATSPHSEIVLGMPTIASGNSYGDASIGVQAVIQADGYKLLIGHVHQNVWTSWTTLTARRRGTMRASRTARRAASTTSSRMRRSTSSCRRRCPPRWPSCARGSRFTTRRCSAPTAARTTMRGAAPRSTSITGSGARSCLKSRASHRRGNDGRADAVTVNRAPLLDARTARRPHPLPYLQSVRRRRSVSA